MHAENLVVKRIIFGSVICLLLFIGYLFELSSRITTLQTSWSENNYRLLSEAQAIEVILGQLGYTGYIHNYKNYVLRRDPRYLENMQQNIAVFRSNTDVLRKLVVEEDAQRALDSLESTIEIYQRNAMSFQSDTSHLSAEALDTIVKVDDTSANKAIKLLMHRIEQNNAVVRKNNEDHLRETQQFLLFGNVVVVVLILQTVAIIFYLRREQRTNRSRVEALNQIDELIDASPDALLVVNEHGLIERVNQMAPDVFQCSANDLLGKHVETLIPEERRHKHKQYREAFLKTGSNINMNARNDLQALRPNGSVFDTEISLNRTRVQGRPAAILALRDVTEQRVTERAVQQRTRLEALGHLTAGVAHDFNNILMTISGNNELIKLHMPDNDEKLHTLLHTSDAAISRAAELTKRLLAFGRKQSLTPQNHDPKHILEDMASVLRRTLGETILLALKVEDGIWPVYTDKSQLESAVLNLCLNAKHAMPKGGTLNITAENTSLNKELQDEFGMPISGEFVLLTIADNGFGIAKSVVEHIFEPFFTTKEDSGGSGLGLSMVYGFINQSHGHLKIHSEEGQGTSVLLYLPVAKEATPNPFRSETQYGDVDLTTESVPPESITILVVEDDDGVRAIPVALLTQQGFNVLEAATPDEALAIARQTPAIDLLFTDIILSSEQDGVGLYKQIKQIHPDIRVLFTTGYAHEETLQALKATGQSDILKKPYAKDVFDAAIRHAILSNPLKTT